ncbi:hypothetical protein HUE58_02060 [Candidatus Ruthia endofausta]|uniref:Uncharacterized protein n=1 Tax=Candidatus Ruthia endofausta TaxID=2738852 RepID=A0A6N0HNS7_9GAMM|nr:hypothetical protein [Candidatus Ruthia endofausta]QKQ23974.1 hypothetical protein HUE58_02060 [Candidatus Ruthia endofausta]
MILRSQLACESSADLDSNDDGIINQDDIKFNNLRLWQDTNQNGISQQDELNFTKSDGTIGKARELFVDQNEFYSKFVTV